MNFWDVIAIGIMATVALVLGVYALSISEHQLSSHPLPFCPNNYVPSFFNCPPAQQFQNATGQYCNGVMVCQN